MKNEIKKRFQSWTRLLNKSYNQTSCTLSLLGLPVSLACLALCLFAQAFMPCVNFVYIRSTIVLGIIGIAVSSVGLLLLMLLLWRYHEVYGEDIKLWEDMDYLNNTIERQCYTLYYIEIGIHTTWIGCLLAELVLLMMSI